VDFRIINGNIEFRTWRDNKATKKERTPKKDER
jgi:hypothetical protein